MIYELKIDKEGFKGFAKVEIPKFSERMAILKETNFKDGQNIDQVDQVVKMVDLAKEKTKELEVKHVGGVEFKSVDSLVDYNGTLPIVYEIAGIILNGVPLGN